jgi:hypothetical protein
VREEISFAEAAAHVERGFLRTLAASAPDEALRELAGEILAGNLTWSRAARSMAYGEVLARTMEPVVTDPRLLDDKAIEGWEREARAFIAGLGGQDGIVVTGLPERAATATPDG